MAMRRWFNWGQWAGKADTFCMPSDQELEKALFEKWQPDTDAVDGTLRIVARGTSVGPVDCGKKTHRRAAA